MQSPDLRWEGNVIVRSSPTSPLPDFICEVFPVVFQLACKMAQFLESHFPRGLPHLRRWYILWHFANRCHSEQIGADPVSTPLLPHVPMVNSAVVALKKDYTTETSRLTWHCPTLLISSLIRLGCSWDS